MFVKTFSNLAETKISAQLILRKFNSYFMQAMQCANTKCRFTCNSRRPSLNQGHLEFPF